jgi:hypothetical protein
MATMSLSSSSGSAPPSSSLVVGRDSAAWEVTNVLAQLHQIPLADAFERVAWVHETYMEYAAEYAKEEAEAKVENEGKEERRGSVDVSAVSADAEMSVRRALASLGLHASATRKLPSRLLATLTELAIWLLFDPVAMRQLQSAAVTATEALADATLVRRRLSRAVFFLHDHIGRFLERRFQTTIGDVLSECEALGMQLQHEADAHASVLIATSLTSLNRAREGGEGAMRGQAAFVAQAREVLIATRPTKRRRLPEEDTLVKPRGSDMALSHHLSRHWTCSLNDVLVHRTSSASAEPTRASLLTLLWFYRQFSAVTLALDASARQLSVRSLFALASPLASQFVLDGRDRFLRAFPAGEATLAMDVGRYAFGDYVGDWTGDAIRLQLYAFLSPSQLPSQDDLPIERLAGDAACVCYDATLRVASDKSLAVDVAVTTAALDVARLRHAGHGDARTLLRDMATWTLRQKLAVLRGGDDASRVEMVYRAGASAV